MVDGVGAIGGSEEGAGNVGPMTCGVDEVLEGEREKREKGASKRRGVDGREREITVCAPTSIHTELRYTHTPHTCMATYSLSLR